MAQAKASAVPRKFEVSNHRRTILTPHSVLELTVFSHFLNAASITLPQGQGAQCLTHQPSLQKVVHPETPSTACPGPANVTKKMTYFTATFDISQGYIAARLHSNLSHHVREQLGVPATFPQCGRVTGFLYSDQEPRVFFTCQPLGGLLCLQNFRSPSPIPRLAE